jgi:hypothetical protein
MGGPLSVVLAIDPGREKCGLAVVEPGRVLHREVVVRAHLRQRAEDLSRHFPVAVVVVGDATGSQDVIAELLELGRPVRVVPEAGTTLVARRRYFQEHPPRGLLRFLPPGLRVPPEPFDDYVAVLLAERYLKTLPESAGGTRQESQGTLS